MPMSIRILRGSHLAKQIVSIGVLFICMTTAVAAALLGKVNHVMNEEIAKDNRYRLEQIKELVEVNTLRRLEQYFVGSVWTGNTSGDIQSLLNNAQPNMNRIMHLNDTLQSTALANRELYNITLYFPNGNYVVDRNHYYSDRRRSPDYEFVAGLTNVKRNAWFGRTSTDKDGNRIDVLTYVYALPMPVSSRSTIKGYLYVDVDASTLMQIVRANILSPSENVVVLQPGGRPLFRSDAMAETEHDASKAAYVSASSDSSLGWQYMLLRNKNSILLASHDLGNDVLRVSAIALCAALLASVFIAYRLDRPIRRILRMDPYLRSKQIADRILGLHDREHAASAADPPPHFYSVAVLETDEDRIKELACEVARLQPQLPYSLEYVTISNRELAVIAIAPEAPDTADMALLGSGLCRLQADCGVDYALGVGPWVDEIGDIHGSYLHAREALRYSFLYGRGIPICYEEIRLRDGVMDHRPDVSLGREVKSGNSERTDRYLHALLSDLQNRPIHIDAVEMAILQEVSSLTQTVLELNMQHIFPYPDIMRSYKKATLKETIVWLSELCHRITKEIDHRSNQYHLQLMQQLKSYIDHHIHEDISLEILAEQASMSPSYVSSLFKDHLHISFSEYLNEARLAEGARLLLEDRGVQVAEVSERVGYRNPQYFITRFKAKYGMTPAIYRKTRWTPVPQSLS